LALLKKMSTEKNEIELTPTTERAAEVSTFHAAASLTTSRKAKGKKKRKHLKTCFFVSACLIARIFIGSFCLNSFNIMNIELVVFSLIFFFFFFF
jgi:hypothetical protein